MATAIRDQIVLGEAHTWRRVTAPINQSSMVGALMWSNPGLLVSLTWSGTIWKNLPFFPPAKLRKIPQSAAAAGAAGVATGAEGSPLVSVVDISEKLTRKWECALYRSDRVLRKN